MSLDTVSDVGEESPFMRLPTEIREMIYRPLLISRYTMREQNMTSETVSRSSLDCLTYTDLLGK